jgi:hypothetical protein
MSISDKDEARYLFGDFGIKSGIDSEEAVFGDINYYIKNKYDPLEYLKKIKIPNIEAYLEIVNSCIQINPEYRPSVGGLISYMTDTIIPQTRIPIKNNLSYLCFIKLEQQGQNNGRVTSFFALSNLVMMLFCISLGQEKKACSS